MKGARSKNAVDLSYVRLLEAGAAQSRTHIEAMAMDMGVLFRRAFPDIDLDVQAFNALGFIDRFRLGGRLIREGSSELSAIGGAMWISDTVRGWCAMAVVDESGLTFNRRVRVLLPYAADHHFAVREWAWLALRPWVVAEPYEALGILHEYSTNPDPNIRRFAVEATRPRSVWGQHIPLFKSEPEVAQTYLSSFKCDPSRYVQHAIGNWINDCSRTRPDWVSRLTTGWVELCNCDATQRIAVRGLRSLRPAIKT